MSDNTERLGRDVIRMLEEEDMTRWTSAHDVVIKDAIRSYLSDRAGSAWHPIETAPKDGTALLCFWAGFDPSNADGRNFGVAMFDDGEWRSPDAQDEDETYSFPTHWQPLPTPPVQT